MWLTLSLTLIFLALAVFLLGVLGYWTPATIRPMKAFLRRYGTRVTASLRSFGTRVTARLRPAQTPECHCLACHAFEGIGLSTKTNHKLLPRLAGQVATGLAHEIEDFLAEVDERA